MTDPNTCTCRGYAAMHKPHPHADRDGSEARAQLEREHECALAADKVEGRCRICGHGTDSDQLACAPCRAVIAGDRYAKEGWLRAERAEAKVRELQPQADGLRAALREVNIAATAEGRARDAAEDRAEKAEAALARVEALLTQWGEAPDYQPSHYDRGRVDQRHMAAEELAAALAEPGAAS